MCIGTESVGQWKQGELLDLSVFPDEAKDKNSQWGEVDSLEININMSSETV